MNVSAGRLESMEKGNPMGKNQQSLDEKRKQQLAALFADEPFLSPTMKARRLHEKLKEMQAGESTTTAEVSLPSDRQFWIEGKKETVTQRSEQHLEDEGRMSFADATAYLRSPYSTMPSHRLHHFRMQVLTQWLRQVPLRETGSHSKNGKR